MNNISEWFKRNYEMFVAMRRDIHMYPELAFNENRTADIIAKQLASYGLSVVQSVGGTGVVGTLKRGNSIRSVGLRADMDALPIDELNVFTYTSQNKGCMHGCGHDGHTVMLLAAAKYLSEINSIDGSVQFIFQPAEEANAQGSGAKAMIDDGLFERFPVDTIYAMHNLPGLAAGAIATRPGSIMASMDLFKVTITGRGTHGAYPQAGRDPIVAATTLVNAWQSIVSRNVSPQDSAVISATSINSGDSYNAIPNTAVIKGSIRTLSSQVQESIKQRFVALTNSLVQGFGCDVDINYEHAYPVTVNNLDCTRFVDEVARSVVGCSKIVTDVQPAMGSEDFAYMLQEKPGCYLWIGNSEVHDSSLPNGHLAFGDMTVETPCMVHEPYYDFNDHIIPIGAAIFSGIAEKHLPIN